uniref:Uncharacterized protein n=1 Tax=Megaselia scalaris TaxID=36166 RepID=T1H1Z5_MEGSC
RERGIFPGNFASHYSYILKEDIIATLIDNNIPRSNDSMNLCDYKQIKISKNQPKSAWEVRLIQG